MPFVAPDALTAARTALGLRVRAERVSQGLTQKQVAVAASCGTQQIIRIETGVDNVYLTTLMNVFHVLGMRLDMRALDDLPDVAPPVAALSLPWRRSARRGRDASWNFPINPQPTNPTSHVEEAFDAGDEDQPLGRGKVLDQGSIVERLDMAVESVEIGEDDGPGSAFSL